MSNDAVNALETCLAMTAQDRLTIAAALLNDATFTFDQLDQFALQLRDDATDALLDALVGGFTQTERDATLAQVQR